MIDDLIESVLIREGGFVNHPDDRGGPTNMGITQKTLADFLSREVSVHDVQNLSKETAVSIYYQNYWMKPGFHKLDLSPVLTDIIFDTAVHSGPRRAVKMLQAAVWCKEDGVMGPKTIAAAERFSELQLACSYMGARIEFLGRLITKQPSQAAFAHGWMRRMKDFLEGVPTLK